jgi:hypothetical protein
MATFRLLKTSSVLACSLALSACAGGVGSFVAGSGGGDSSSEFAQDDTFFEDTAPGLLAAGGNALLPGSRARIASTASPAQAALLGVSPVSAPLASANLSLTANLTGPLLGLNGQRTGLLGLNTTVGLLGVGAQTNVALGGSVSPDTAATRLLISLTSVVNTPAPPSSGGSTSPPAQAPLLPVTVPGVTPLSSLLSRLPTSPVTTPVTGALGGLLGR